MKKYLFLAIILIISLSSVVFAQTPTPTPKTDDIQNVKPENLQGVPPIASKYQSDDKSLPDLGRVGVDMMEQKALSLNDAIKMALENNKDIEVTRQNVKIAEFDLKVADGFYRPKVTGTTYYDRSKLPNLSIFSSEKTTSTGTLVGNLSYNGFIQKYGSTYSVSLNNQRQTTGNSITLLSPQYNSSLNFTFNQPLLRGKKTDPQRRLIEISKKNLSLTDTQFRQKSIDVIATVQRAYWDLTFALRNLQVQRDGVRDAKEQLTHNERLVKEGQLAPIDIVAAETQVANLELAVYDALELVNRAENVLKNLIAENKNAEIWGKAIVPTDKIDLQAPNTTLHEAMQLALQNRPEIEINETAKEINEIDRKFYREQGKPQVDFFASYTTSGVGGSQNPNFSNPFASSVCASPNSPECLAVIARQNSTLTYLGSGATTITDIASQKYPSFRFGITFNFAVNGQTAKANLGKSLVEKEKLETQREQLEQAIQVDVRNALQSLRTAEARLRAASIARENTVKQYESEQRKLDAGQSDIYKVLERQTALMNARSTELRAQTELNKAIADLQRATGNSLKANNVEARLRR